MDRSTRSLRKLPARSAKSAERSSSRGRTIKESDSPQPVAASPRISRRIIKEPDRKEFNMKKASPPRRRSRSRSNARKRAETVKDAKEKEVLVERISSRSLRVAPLPATKIVSRLKESVEHMRNSVSPEVEEVMRKSLSRFEEVTTEVISTIMTRRASSNQSRASSASVVNNIPAPPEDTIKEEDVREEKNTQFTNHTSTLNEKSSAPRETRKVNLFKVLGLILLGIAMCVLVVASHAICTKGDCRLLVSNLPKSLDYSQYFDSYVWPTYTISMVLLYSGCHFFSRKQRKPPHFSVVGSLSAVLLLCSIWTCHQYYSGLQQLRLQPVIGASIIHTLVLIAFAGTSGTLGTVQLESLVQVSSSVLLVLLNACLWAIENARTVPSMAVLVLCGLQSSISFDHFLLPLFSLGLGPIGLLWLSLRPFILVLPQIYISANNVTLGTYAIIGIIFLHVAGYILLRYSLTVKNNYLRDPYSQRFSKSAVCGDFSDGLWGLVRHPQLLGLLLCELSWTAAVLPSPLSAVLVLLSVVSSVFLARTADRRLSRTYRAKITSSLIPLVPF